MVQGQHMITLVRVEAFFLLIWEIDEFIVCVNILRDVLVLLLNREWVVHLMASFHHVITTFLLIVWVEVWRNCIVISAVKLRYLLTELVWLFIRLMKLIILLIRRDHRIVAVCIELIRQWVHHGSPECKVIVAIARFRYDVAVLYPTMGVVSYWSLISGVIKWIEALLLKLLRVH